VFQPATDPQYVYVAAANQVVHYPYRSGEAKAAGPAEVVDVLGGRMTFKVRSDQTD
jgi:hypothetical protein